MMFVILLVEIYVSYKLYVLYKRLNKLEEGSKKQLNEAGNAIADTLRVVFDNLKRQGSKLDKLSSKYTEYQTRFHRLEQTTQRLLSNTDKETPTKQNLEENKNERRNTKAD
jgi:ribosomal 50S subunit-associated protein YjgA (DUF615 family)